jgi:hypothetical protein
MSANQDRIAHEDKNYRYGFTQLPNIVLTSTVLDPTDKIIYGILLRYATMEKGAFPEASTVCLEANISLSTYRRSIKKFIKSDTNPKPEVTLITATQREGTSNLYIIHIITNRIIEKLKAVVTFSKEAKKRAKKQPKMGKKGAKKKAPKPLISKGNLHNLGQNDTPPPSQNDTPPPSQNDTLVILNINNIEQQQENQKNVVVVQDEFKKSFEKTITKKQAEELIKLAIENEKSIVDCIEETVTYYKQSGKEKKNSYGAVIYAITTGWDIENAPTKETTSVGVNRPTQTDILNQQAVEDKMKLIIEERRQKKEAARRGA